MAGVTAYKDIDDEFPTNNGVRETKILMKTTAENGATRNFCEWEIHQFSCILKRMGEFVESSPVTLDLPGRHSFCLRVYPYDTKCSFGDRFVDVSFCWMAGNFSARINKMEFLAGNEKLKSGKCDLSVFCDADCCRSFSIMRRDDLITKLATRPLVIRCEVEAVIRDSNLATVFTTVPDYNISAEENLRKFSKNLVSQFDEQLLVDCTFECHDNSIGAHKVILASQSPVFQAMFSHDLKESKTGKIPIIDIDFAILKEMLRFIYSFEPPTNLAEIAEKLLIAANKYQLSDLKAICEISLMKQLNAENVCATYAIGKFHDSPRLKQCASDYAKCKSDLTIDSLLETLTSDISFVEIFNKKK